MFIFNVNIYVQEELDGIIEELDEDGSGTMDFDEFCEMMMPAPANQDLSLILDIYITPCNPEYLDVQPCNPGYLDPTL